MYKEFSEKAIGKANREKEELAKMYGVEVSAIVWCGSCKFIIVKNGESIRIGF